jgi:hypothetical protein
VDDPAFSCSVSIADFAAMKKAIFLMQLKMQPSRRETMKPSPLGALVTGD